MAASNDVLEMMTASQVQQPKSSVGVYELPCGYLDPNGELHTEVLLSEITGRDEDMLANNKIPSSKKLNQLLISCIQRIGSLTEKKDIAAAVPELLVGDRVFLMLAIRRVSLGDEYPYRDKCPACEKESLMTINLSELEVTKMPEPKKYIYDVRLPSREACKVWTNTGELPETEKLNPTGRSIRFRMMKGKDEEQVGRVQGKDDAVSKLLQIRIELLDGKPPELEDFQKMTMAERSFIRDELFQRYDGGVETTLEVECPLCGFEYERELDVGQTGFFFPSQVRKNSKIRSST